MDKFIVKRGRVESVDDGESSPPYAQSAVVTTDNVQATSCKTIAPVGTYSVINTSILVIRMPVFQNIVAKWP